MIFAIMLAAAPITACGPDEPEQTQKPVVKPDPKPDPQPDPQPTAKGTILTLVTGGSHAVALSTVDKNSYLVKCTGGDPYIFTNKLPSAVPSDYTMIEFEYKTDTDLTADLQIFYALSGSPSESSSQKYGTIASTSSYKKFTADISTFRANGWGKAGDNLRIDPGDNSGPNFYIRNITIRQMTEEEQKIHDEAAAKEQSKIDIANHLEKYLSTKYPSSVKKVAVTSTKVTIEGTVGGDGTYILADVTPWQDVTELKTFPYTEKISGKDFTVTLDRYVKGREGIDYDRVFSKWAVVKVEGETQTLDSHARYADEVAAKRSPAAIPLKNKKGFGAGDHTYYFDDIKTMDAGSITMNVVLNNYVTGRGGTYVYGGLAYRIGQTQNYVDMVLSKVKSMGTVVSAIILCQKGSAYDDPECTGGYYSIPNMTTAEAFNMYAAALEAMADRYSRDDIGRISHWIMHNEVDSQKTWTNMGDQPMMRYLDRYVKSMRICYNIVRQYDQNAAILGSYTHSWTGLGEDYSPKEMMDMTVKYSEAEGDFWWGIAYHPYPQDLSRPEFWNNDTQSTYSMKSKYVTFKNLEVLDKWMKLKENLYKGEKKRICFLSENGTNSPTYSASDLEKQAAGGAWAWKKVQKLDGIDAIQWHNWADNRAEFGLRIGLRAFEEGSFKSLDPKPVWHVWKAAGSSEEDAVFEPYLNTIGVSSWDSIMRTVD